MKKYGLILATLTSLISMTNDETRLLRFPTIYKDRIVFSYAGDLYQVASTGGVARKLTNHNGFEIFPRFSPDGKHIAFTGQYDGNTEVYLMNATGGSPKRLTVTATLGRDDVADRMGPNNLVMTWKNTSDQIVFRSRKNSYNPFNGQLFAVSSSGGIPETLPFPRGGFCSFSPDDSKLAYNRIFREFRTWKRYKGGMADDIWVYDFKSKELINITNNPHQDIIPMWTENTIYFISDRSGRMNLYSYDLNTKETKQHTSFKEFDIKFPSLGPNAIVYENAGYIYRFDLMNQTNKKVPITISDDFQSGRGGLLSVSDQISNFEISPDGKRALFGARGDVFTVPVEYGPTRNLTASSGAHDRASKWSPNGKWIAFISDKSGEDEIYIVDSMGKEDPRKISSGNDVYIFNGLYWSPDSTKISWVDRKLRLRFLDIKTGKITDVATSQFSNRGNMAWSPDSNWLAFDRAEKEGMGRVWLYSVATGETIPATTSWFDSYAPTFSDDGNFLFVISERNFHPIYSRTEWNHAYGPMARIYMIALNKDVASPFAPKSDEVAIAEDKTFASDISADPKKGNQNDSDKKNTAGTKPNNLVKVEKEGIYHRIMELPIEVADYSNLTSVDNTLFYVRYPSEGPNILCRFDFDSLKETELGNFNGFEISVDNKKMLLGSHGQFAIISTPNGKIKITDFMDLSGMEVKLNRKEEWRQIFNESWRQMRDFFYAPNMHGVDWKGVHNKYEPLLAHVNHRNDLTYIIGEMIGELNVGHAYVGGGDRPTPRRIQTGLLGAQLHKDPKTGYFKIEKILDGESWENNLQSPLKRLGVNASKGDFIIKVDGLDTSKMNNIYEALVNKVDTPVVLEINSKPSPIGAHKTTVQPIADESNLYYHDWVQTNIRKVSEATDGKVGYLHVPDMGRGGLNEFVKHYYPQLQKKALIIDVRGNGGGNVSPHLIERLRRDAAMVRVGRGEAPTPDPGEVFLGPMVCLLDEFSASDGDIFPYRFKHSGLGKLIGKRSWGGIVGIRGSLPFIDGGSLNKPEFTGYSPNGEGWVVEGYGVDPDIEVDNHPAMEFEGIDQQLNRAIEEILKDLEKQGRELPPIPAFPIRK